VSRPNPLVGIPAMALVVFASQSLATAASTPGPDFKTRPKVPIEVLKPYDTDQLEAFEAIDALTPHIEAHPYDMVARRFRAGYLIMLERYEAAIQDLTDVLQAEPDDVLSKETLIYTHHFLAQRSYAENRFDEALSRIERAVQLDPEKTFPRYYRALYHAELGQFDDAIADLLYVREHEPNSEYARLFLATCYNQASYRLYLKRERPEKALEMIEQAIILNPENSFWMGTKAEILYVLERYEEALPLIQRALEDYPDHPEMLADLQRITAALQR